MTTGERTGAAPRPGDGVVHVVALWQALPAAAGEVRGILAELAASSAREPGCRRFTVLEASGHPGRFVLIEEYAGEEGRRRHQQSAPFRRLVLERAVPLLERREVDAYDVLHGGSVTG